MSAKTTSIVLLLISLLWASAVKADRYLELSTGLVFVRAPADTVRPLVLDFRIGVSEPDHQYELALMVGINEDRLNQMELDVPSIVSAFYHFIPDTRGPVDLHLVLGASRVDVESTFAGSAATSDSYYGLSYGIGLEEKFESIPRLKLSLDFLQLYRGDKLDIYSTSLGVHYEF